MSNVSAILFKSTTLDIVVLAARTCTDTWSSSDTLFEDDDLGPDDTRMLRRILCKPESRFNPPHDSILEHCVYTFKLRCSRACLQELARHRHASLSVQSTRYALKKIIKGAEKKRIYDVGSEEVESYGAGSVSMVCQLKRDGLPNDVAKYGLCESFMTELIWTINGRSLRNFLALRTPPRALQEIRELAYAIYREVPDAHKFLYLDYVWEE